ncbi:hypothetical protein PFISCL1PPCAC_15181, partial [Pristionchus fissidentatus]
CLVCNSLTKHAHLSVLICRACKIFYNRTERRKRPLICRSNRMKCRNVPRCKKCRYEKIDRLVRGIDESEMEEKEECTKRPSSSTRTSTSSSSSIDDSPVQNCTVPKSAPFLCIDSLDSRLCLLEQVRFSYRTMSISRRAAEMSTLHAGRHPMFSFYHEYPLKPATITSMNLALRILTTTIFDFAATVFEEFSELSMLDKWYLVKNFFHSFWTLESAFRVFTLFPHLQNFHFTSLTTYLNDDAAAEFMDLAPRTPRAKDDTKCLLRSFLRGDTRIGREAVRKAAISEEEFLALLVLCFWNVENTTNDDSLISLGVFYRMKVMKELQEFYKRQGNEEDCAKRIGEIMGLVVVLESLASSMPMNLELFRLLNVFDDNTTLYQMTKSGVPNGFNEVESGISGRQLMT